MMKTTTFSSKVLLTFIHLSLTSYLVILVGDTGVGKTHLLSRYIKDALPKNKFPTIGVEFATKPVPLRTGGTVKA
jgi:Rab family protein